MDPFDCQEFHELCMDYRGAAPQHAQGVYERLQAYCRRERSVSYNAGWNAGWNDGRVHEHSK
jgi:hypothetical protein